ncbi:MAG TPA: UDP-N-acetylmuramoyl-L-alanyl-D-glutamate--2,6-diaminopimelate ligase [Candidatus Binatia bacterium]|nr:UDP-N-acetylmuramoyl-L-alanyl-D-glutamate--2,6-diaminopimelate ligase [Candidatus Binatia bacterium]
MQVREFLALQEVEQADGDLQQEVTGLTYDSRKAAAGTVFFAVPGEKTDGHDYIGEAVKRGAAAVVVSCSGAWPPAPATVRVKNVRSAMGLWAAQFYHRPSRNIRLIGVTGTNGKTTLTYLVESILRAAGLEPGVIGTINYRYPGREVPSHHTTPESIDLQELLAQMTESGVRAVAMEVSSHALAQERVRGLEFDVGVFTNLSRDHLEYHRDMDEYFAAKRRLFDDYLPASVKPDKAAVIYADDPRGEQLIAACRAQGLAVWSYGNRGKWDVRPVQVTADASGIRGEIKARERRVKFASPLVGSVNLLNILGAVGVGCALGLTDGAIARGIAGMHKVPGRLEKVDNPRGVVVLVDYAHTPDALEKTLQVVRQLTDKKLIAVFGCGGDRDRGKRPLMGEIAARLSDLAVLTSDNPRTENPQAILEEVEAGVRKVGIARLDAASAAADGAAAPHRRGYYVEADRRAAIRLALSLASAGDAVLIAGKGHEDYQILGTSKIHFDDREVAREESALRANG